MTKPVLRQSHFQNYLKCPRSFKLSQEHDIEQTKSMDTGKIFEFLVFGFKSEEEKEQLIHTKAGKVKADFINLKELAIKIRTQFFGVGVSHQRYTIDMGEYELSGEIDFDGGLVYNGQIVDCLSDLKWCADVPKIWPYKQKKSDFFQSVSYPFIYWKKTGKIKPFYYVIVDKSGNVKIIHIKYDWKKAFAWYESVLEMAWNDGLYEPNYDECKGHGKFDPRCKYLDWCMFGIDFVFGYEEIEFDSLQDDIEIQVSEKKLFDAVDNSKKKVFNESILNSEEPEESDIDELISKPKFDRVTVDRAEKQVNGLYYCRSCSSRDIKPESDKCECGTKVMWI